jgi:hypothetical protein
MLDTSQVEWGRGLVLLMDMPKQHGVMSSSVEHTLARPFLLPEAMIS